MSTLLTLLGMWAVTYAARLIGLGLGGVRLPPFWLAFLRFVPISVFVALIVPGISTSQDWPQQVLACAVGAALLWRTRALIWGILGGFAVYWLLRQIW
ncbi:branched-chain amino acid transport [Deinococcus irradiatisoli]|uniref:Branched-chain amino acid transport n=1 Tax=Deinococcus irradiatisoli TaxID=2202254 RepID=A0A2Z3JB97_9DEIO|nr:AzlD domain-containing protein [Deinococcus irradiatisoli]AWN22423.1 branched-chain amino acid transport [Deinococcus irradiatisoli]